MILVGKNLVYAGMDVKDYSKGIGPVGSETPRKRFIIGRR